VRLLAVDASTENCSAALLLGDRLMLRSTLTERGHAELLLPMIDELLKAAATSLRDLDALAFGRGPGGFTGLRLAAGVVQGLALATGLPVVPVSSLAAVAWQVDARCDEPVLVCNDARMGEVYVGCFAKTGETVDPLADESVLTPELVLSRSWPARHAAGNGLARYVTLASGLRQAGLQVHDNVYPRADAVAQLARHQFAHGHAVDAADVAVVYVRNEVARPAGAGVTAM
jgi:tRNA threonylcarbamoyladenosine biosynthesis protein TsaB